MKHLLEFANKYIEKHIPCGSRVTCNPPPTDTDRDWLVLANDAVWLDFCNCMLAAGWEIGGSQIPDEANTCHPDHRFNSFVLGEDNIIATTSSVFFQRFEAATALSKRLNLLLKDDRIALFQAVLYGKF